MWFTFESSFTWFTLSDLQNKNRSRPRPSLPTTTSRTCDKVTQFEDFSQYSCSIFAFDSETPLVNFIVVINIFVLLLF